MKQRTVEFLNNTKKYLKFFVIFFLILLFLSLLAVTYTFRDLVSTNWLPELLNTSYKEKPVEITNNIVSEESVVINVVEKVGESIVSITYLDDIFSDKGTPIGSGVVISEDGLIVTNKHVIEDTDGTYEVVLQDGTSYRVVEVIKAKSKDLALVRIEASKLKPINMGDSSKIKLGQKAIAVGNALGFSNTVSVGIVSGLARELEVEGELFKNLIQTDAAINPGNSGGALLNSNGDLIGINTAKSPYADNIGFAIPVSAVKNLIESYKKGEIDVNSVPAFLGIGFTFRDLKDYLNKGLPIGPVITGVLRNSPADKAGLRAGDIIVSINNTEFSDEYELSEFIKEKNPGDEVLIKIYRKNSNLELKAVLGESVN
jgi:S1-C subfamily serine protease